MNKKEFIKALEERLSILDENELKDIINEYKDTIDEKVKHGKSEKEAVADFGSIDELAHEILKAYKINPKYGEKKDTVKEVVDDCEDLIKKGANKLAGWTQKIADDFKNADNELTVELIFEIIIKAFLLLVLCAFLRLPFEFFRYLGTSILDATFYPLDEILGIIWRIVVWILYFVSCVLMAIAMFRQYFKALPKEKPVKKKEVNEKKESFKKEETLEKREPIQKEVVVKRNGGNSVFDTLGHVLFTCFKVGAILFIFIPLWFINVGLYIGIAFLIYYLITGLPILGLLFLFVGLAGIFTYFTQILYYAIFEPKKVYFFPFIINIIFVVVGSLLLVDTISRIDYIREVPKDDFHLASETFDYHISENTRIRNLDGNVEQVVDEKLEDGKIVIEVRYYDDVISIATNEYEEMYPVIVVEHKYFSHYRDRGWKVYRSIIDNLKEEKFYDYGELFQCDVLVYGNEKTLQLIK